MNFITPYIQTIRTIAIIIGIALAIWFYKDWKFQTIENKRQYENNRQTRISDSLRFSSQILTANEIKEHLQYQNSELKNKLLKDGIKPDRIKEIVSTKYFYRDSIQKKYYKGHFIDSTKCLVIKGQIDTNGTVTITNREFKNKTDAVAYWQRREWKFLGLKTRFLGKKEMTAKVYDECGLSQIIKIEKKE